MVSLVFLAIGLEVDVPALLDERALVLWAIGAVLGARVLVVYSLGWAVRFAGEPLPLRWLHVLSWSGLRGAISLALALSLPASFGDERGQLLVMTFGVVLFTLLVQGTTAAPLLRRLGVVGQRAATAAFEQQRAEVAALHAAERRLDELRQLGLVSAPTWTVLKPALERGIATRNDALGATLTEHPGLAEEELRATRAELLRAQRAALQALRHEGALSAEAYELLAAAIDGQLDALASPHPAPDEV